MSYLALARRYRPDDFSRILAQNHITKTLTNAVSSGRIAQAYLFCGPRGTGKTSTARVLAKSLNCEKGPTSIPCGECSNCREIKAGISPDVFEIDAASNRGIDDIRELRENVRYSPVASRYKIYIIDEVHRLTPEAFDALLKTLEEPPAHVIFIFATTEPQQLPATILSRTQRFDFKRVPVSTLAEAVNNVAKEEGLEIEPRAALLIARKADGSLRDALSLLDQLTNFSEDRITTESTSEILGLVKSDFLFDITSAIINHDTAAALEMFSIYFSEGGDIDELASELASYFGKLVMVKNGIGETSLLEMDTMELEKTAALIADIDTADILRMMQIMADFIAAKKSGSDPVVAIEVALARLAGLDKAVDINQLLTGLSNPGNRVKLVSNHSLKTGAQNAGRTALSNTKSSIYNPASRSNTQPKTSTIPLSGPHNLDDINKWWPNFLSFTKAKSMAVWSNLQHLVVDSVDKKIVNLGYTEKQKHLKKFLSKDKKIISEFLKEFCGNDVAASFVKITINDNEIDSKQTDVQGSADEFLNQRPLIKKLHDLIDGEVIDFRGN